MRAVVLDEGGQPALGEVPEPDGSGELVDVVACGLCGTDVQKLGRAAAGTVLGHEVVGRGEDGRRGALVHHLPCGACDRCRAGHETTCARFPEPTILPAGSRSARALQRRSRSRTRSTTRQGRSPSSRLRAPGSRAHLAGASSWSAAASPACSSRRRSCAAVTTSSPPTRLRTASSWRSATALSRPTASRSTPRFSARTRVSTARSPRSNRAEPCSSSPGSSIPRRSTSRPSCGAS